MASVQAARRPTSVLMVMVLLLAGQPSTMNDGHGNFVMAVDPIEWFRSLVSGSSSPSSSSSSSSSAALRDSSQTNSAINDLERDTSVLVRQSVRSPAQIVRSNFRNGRYVSDTTGTNLFSWPTLDRDLFKCVEPTASMYRQFVRQYDRKFDDDTERLERLNLYAVTLKRAILLNRILQNEITNATNYQVKPQIGDYHFVEPTTQGGENVGAIWYADITDCELGLIKHILFNIIYHIDNNDFNLALKIALENSDHLPLFTEDGFEQLTNILLIRLYDRFRGDDKMNQLFRWPLYMKKLAAYAYSLRESMRPNFKDRLALISFAYPAYFKDIKYNWPAINRTGDNLRANSEHKNFNSVHNRNFVNLRERNKRLVVLRQHWSLINQINDDPSNRFKNSSVEPDWSQINEPNQFQGAQSEKLVDSKAEEQNNSQGSRKLKLTQFSDLTDNEFVAFLTNDYESLLGNNRDSQIFMMQNFQIRPLDDQLRNEIAQELEFRRNLIPMLYSLNRAATNDDDTFRAKFPTLFKHNSLARQVVDELISDVGLPIGPVSLDNINEQEFYSAFTSVTSHTAKSYLNSRNSGQQSSRFVEPSSFSSNYSLLTDSDLADERQRRYGIFKENYPRFRAWFIKEGWQLNDQQSISMLRFADMSWYEIKLTLFKVCCLTDSNLELLSRENATLQYLASNYKTFCQQMMPSEPVFTFGSSATGSLRNDQQQLFTREKQTAETVALELYYYYSVHFNKHHSDQLEFDRKFNIFRKNIDAIRRHSCKRDLTLFSSLKLKQSETLSTIDVLDPRRSYTDDLNLDRFEYFNIPKTVQGTSSNLFATAPSTFDVDIDASRASISYRRGSSRFGLLLNNVPTQDYGLNQPAYSYADKLLEWKEDVNEFASRYNRLGVRKIYDFVMQRYRYCMKSLKGVDLDSTRLKQQCQTTGGQFEDKAASGLAGATLWTQDESLSSRDTLARLQHQDQCSFYRLGLEPWAEGLITQDTLSAQLIQTARCLQAR